MIESLTAEIPHPTREGWTLLLDIEFLTSRYSCIYGAGCKGIELNKPKAGCCSIGAFYADDEDRKNTERMFEENMPSRLMENYATAKRLGVSAKSGNDWKTRVVNGSCIFLNRKPGNEGCSLHVLAQEMDVSHVKTKPHICWLIPISAEEDEDDQTIYITRHTVDDWGGNDDEPAIEYWCMGDEEANTANALPVFISHHAELTNELGEEAYKALCNALRRFYPNGDLFNRSTFMEDGLTVKKLIHLTIVTE